MGLIRKFTLVAGMAATMTGIGAGAFVARGLSQDTVENFLTCSENAEKGRPCTPQQVKAEQAVIGSVMVAGNAFFIGTTLLSLGLFAGRKPK